MTFIINISMNIVIATSILKDKPFSYNSKW